MLELEFEWIDHQRNFCFQLEIYLSEQGEFFVLASQHTIAIIDDVAVRKRTRPFSMSSAAVVLLE